VFTKTDGSKVEIEDEGTISYRATHPDVAEQDIQSIVTFRVATGNKIREIVRKDEQLIVRQTIDSCGNLAAVRAPRQKKIDKKKKTPTSGAKDDEIPETEDEEQAARDRRDLKAEADSLQHLLTHFPKNPHCKTCQVTKSQRKQCRNKSHLIKHKDAMLRAFGDAITADHISAHDDESPMAKLALGLDEFNRRCPCALGILDYHTKYRDMFPCVDKTAETAENKLREFLGVDVIPKFAYSDNSKELRRAMQDLQIIHGTSTPGRPETNGRAERNVRHILEGARAQLFHAGIPTFLWPFAVRHFSLMSNITKTTYRDVDGNAYDSTPFEMRHGVTFPLPVIPLGQEVYFQPEKSPKNSTDKFKFEPNARMGIFMGYHLQPGGIPSGDYYVIDILEFNDLDFANFHRKSDNRPLSAYIHVHRTKEVVSPLQSDIGRFPLKHRADHAAEVFASKSNQHWFHFEDSAGNTIIRSDYRSVGAPDGPEVDSDTDHALGMPSFPGEEPEVGQAEVGGLSAPGFNSSSSSSLREPPPVEVEGQLVPPNARVVAMQSCARKRREYGKPIEGVFPVFDSKDRYIGDYIDDFYVPCPKPTRRPLHIRPFDWNLPMPELEKRMNIDHWNDAVHKAIDSLPDPGFKHPAAPAEVCCACKAKIRSERSFLNPSDPNTQLPSIDSLMSENKGDDGSDDCLNAAYFPEALEALQKLLNIPEPQGEGDSESCPSAAAPTLSTFVFRNRHRDKIPNFGHLPFNACVARPVGKKEVQQQPKAQAAVKAEWDRLRKIHTWDEDGVREWQHVARDACDKKKKAHVGRVFNICVEKNSELQPEFRKYKGRTVFQGNQVKDECWEVAMFQNLGSSPASMEAAKAANLIGMPPGNKTMQADATQAYTQTELKGVPTWVRRF